MRAAFAHATAPGQAERMNRALERISADFTVQAMADRLSEIYAGVASTAGRS